MDVSPILLNVSLKVITSSAVSNQDSALLTKNLRKRYTIELSLGKYVQQHKDKNHAG